MRHPKKCKYFDLNNKCKFQNCAYAHTKDDSKVKIDNLEMKCGDLESDLRTVKKMNEQSHSQRDMLGRGIMKLKGDVEKLTTICMEMKSSIMILESENYIIKQCKNNDIEKQINKVKPK